MMSREFLLRHGKVITRDLYTMRRKITSRCLESLQRHVRDTRRSVYVWDTELVGFGAYVSKNGRVSWLVQRWVGGRGGKAVRYTIDRASLLPLEEARQRAVVHLGEIGAGIDPVDRRRRQRKAINDEINGVRVGDAVAKFIQRKSTGNRYWADVTRLFDNTIVPALGKDTLLSRVTKVQVRDLIEAKQDAGTHGSARNIYAAIRPFFAWCVQRDLLAVSPITGIEPPKPLASRDRILSREELVALWLSTNELSEPFGHFYRLLILTGQRREEVGGMLDSELNLSDRLWIIPASRTKNGREHTVHLSDQAMAVLATVPRVAGSPYVFSTTGKNPISGHSKIKTRLDTLMTDRLSGRLKPWKTHDIRRTMTSGLAELGVSTDVADRILNHVSGSSRDGVKGVYQRYEFMPERKRAIELWGDHVERLTSHENNNRVVKLRA